MGAEDVWDRDRIVALMDHWAPAPSPQVADTHNECREFTKEYRITNWYGMECKGIAGKVEEGGIVEADLEQGVVRNVTKNEKFEATKLPDFLLDILKAGGAVAAYRREELRNT